MKYSSLPGIGRSNIIGAGEDFEKIVGSLEKEGQANETVVFQFSLNLADSWVEPAMEILSKKGYFFCGCTPR